MPAMTTFDTCFVFFKTSIWTRRNSLCQMLIAGNLSLVRMILRGKEIVSCFWIDWKTVSACCTRNDGGSSISTLTRLWLRRLYVHVCGLFIKGLPTFVWPIARDTVSRAHRAIHHERASYHVNFSRGQEHHSNVKYSVRWSFETLCIHASLLGYHFEGVNRIM